MARIFDETGAPLYRDYRPGEMLPPGYSTKPFFPGYTYSAGKSLYRGVSVGEGGYVYAEEGMYGNVALLDIASMHPSSIVAEELFGPRYTQRFKDLMDIRIAIKHGEFDRARTMLDGKLAPYLSDEKSAKTLSTALKTAINSVYGLTSASFTNPFRDPRNVDNIVAKRGALFMVNLCDEVKKRGYKVAHIKTDSIKIPDADDYIINFVMEYGKEFGYTFEHEATYDRMCLVNHAVYIARYADGHWTATGKQFQVPYVFKTLFSKEDISLKDLCETFSVSNSALYLDDRFIGRVGGFVPVKEGYGGGILGREAFDKDGNRKMDAPSGSKGYLWAEYETIEKLGDMAMDAIDKTYYNHLVDDAVEEISKYGDFEWFISDAPYTKGLLER